MATQKRKTPMRKRGNPHTLESIHARCEEVGDCWEWQGALSNGRPQLRSADQKVVSVRAYIAHTLQGQPARDDRYVTFKCGNPQCVNPDHFATVTRATLQKMTAERTGYAAHPARRAKLSKAATARVGKVTPEQVANIRAMDGTMRGISRETGISFDVVRKIRNGVTYRQVGNPWAGLMQGVAA
jgi:hypothetical protein